MANFKKDDSDAPRVPLGQHRLKLQLSAKDLADLTRRQWVTRWVNDDGGRISQALAGGYKFVEPEEATSLGSSTIHEGEWSKGSQVRQVVSKGKDVMYAYLMKIQRELYDRDQAAKMGIIDHNERTSLMQGTAGGAEIDSGFRLDDGQKSVVTMQQP